MSGFMQSLGATCLVAVGAAGSAAAAPLTATAVPAVKHVMIVIFENQDAGPSEEQPFFAQLATQGALASDLRAEVHPSQGNYIALTSGDLQGVTGDGHYDLDVQNIADLVEAKGKTWKAYVEGWPGHCFTGATKGRYARKHVPFISYTDISQNAARCANIVDASQLTTDIANGTLPDYAFYTPNMDDDAHDTDLSFANNWYSTTFGPLITDSRFMDGMLLITTFDESTTTEPGNVIYTSFFGSMVKPGSVYSTTINHYNILRTVEDGLGIGTLGLSDASAAPLTGIWK